LYDGVVEAPGGEALSCEVLRSAADLLLPCSRVVCANRLPLMVNTQIDTMRVLSRTTSRTQLLVPHFETWVTFEAVLGLEKAPVGLPVMIGIGTTGARPYMEQRLSAAA